MTPIKTIIRNKRPVAKAVNYIGKSPVWLPANGEAVVDFEIWGVADSSQRTSIRTLVQTGAIELSIMVLGANGEYTVVPFDPVGGAKPAAPVEAKKEEPAILNPVKQMADEKDHIVKVGSPESKAILEGMGAKAVGFEDEIIPAREVKNGEPEAAKEVPPENDGTVNNVSGANQAPQAEDAAEAPKKTRKKAKAE